MALNFESRELANQYIIASLLPKNWPVNVKLGNLTVMKKDKVLVDRTYNVYFKKNPTQIKKVVKEKVQEEKWTETHNFTNYLQSESDWRADASKYRWNNETKADGYYV